MARSIWTKIKTEYITSALSYRKLAEKHGVSVSDLCDRGKREGWVALRRQHRDKVVAKAVQKAADTEADRLARVGQLAYKALDVAMEAFEDDKQFHRYIVSEDRGLGESETVEREFRKVDTKALRDLTTVIKDLTSVIRNVYGLPTQAEAEAQRVAAERLDLERRKVDAEGDTDTTITICMEGDAEKWSK